MIDNSVKCEEIIEMTKNILSKSAPTKKIPAHFNKKRDLQN